MKETIDTIIAWHKETFPNATLDGQKEKWKEEYKEYLYTEMNTEEELFEIADMIIVSAGIARFDYWLGLDYLYETFAITYKRLGRCVNAWEAVQKKMEINKKRKWKKTAEGTYHHENGIED